MSEPIKDIASLSAEQVERMSEQLLAYGPFRILSVKRTGRVAEVCAEFKDGSKRRVTV